MSRDAVISQINANIAGQSLPDEQDNQQESSQEEQQLDAAVATLDPINEIKLRREQERLEVEKQKEKERQEDRIRKLQKEAAEGNEKAQRELELEKRKQTDEAIKAGTDAFKGVQEQVFNTASKVRDTAGGAWDSIGRVAIPGSIWLPVAILLIFFFLLLPINGYTRMQWLWLALTGQAHIETGGGGGGGGTRLYTGVSVV